MHKQTVLATAIFFFLELADAPISAAIDFNITNVLLSFAFGTAKTAAQSSASYFKRTKQES